MTEYVYTPKFIACFSIYASSVYASMYLRVYLSDTHDMMRDTVCVAYIPAVQATPPRPPRASASRGGPPLRPPRKRSEDQKGTAADASLVSDASTPSPRRENREA